MLNKGYESEVRYYSRRFPKIFNKAVGSKIYSQNGEAYLDFLSGAGALNYGHNNKEIKKAIIDYLNDDRIMHGLDFSTSIKNEFLTSFNEIILTPRKMEYKIMFPGPTGTNAVEAALKLARKVTGRSSIIAFSGGFHGMSLGSLAASSSRKIRESSSSLLTNVNFFPFPSKENEHFNTLKYLENTLADDHSGIDIPAAIIVETIQAEGGVNVIPIKWLQELQKICTEYKILLIIDDIQVGCGRTGNFFSFENANIQPDLIVLSKSISGIGLPMSLLLFKPDIDLWFAGEHNGTFRGNQLAFVGAKEALEIYYHNNDLLDQVKEFDILVQDFVLTNILPLSNELTHRGTGLIHGIDFNSLDNSIIIKVQDYCFENNLIIETCGRNGNVLKILPSLTIDKNELLQGLEIIKKGIFENIKINKSF